MTTWTVIHPDGSSLPEGDNTEYRWVPSIMAPTSIIDTALAACAREVAERPGSVLGPYKREARTTHWLDLGGIAWSERKLYELAPIDGLTLSVPATNVEGYIEVIDSCRPERATQLEGAPVVWRLPVYVIELWLEQRHLAELRAQLNALLPEANAIASIENDRHNRKMYEARLRGVPVLSPKRPVRRPEEA